MASECFRLGNHFILQCMYLIVPDTLVQNIQDVTEEDVLTSVEQAVKKNTTLERLEVNNRRSKMNWMNVAESILKGAAANQNLRELELWMNEHTPKQEVVDNVRKFNQKLRLIVKLGK